MTSERANTLRPHRVALVRHGRGTDLVLLERFLDLLEVGEETDVGRDLVGSGTERGERAEDVDIDLARVGLAGDGVGVLKARELGDEAVELFDLSSIRRAKVSAGSANQADIRTQLTLSWSPSKRARKDAWVPVVPLTPRKPMSSRARWMLRRSQRSSCSGVPAGES